jgi:hypothetical protein
MSKFMVVRCGRHGYGVAVPSTEFGEDLDMILWGVTKEKAQEHAQELWRRDYLQGLKRTPLAGPEKSP